jgi:hypothetical protein
MSTFLENPLPVAVAGGLIALVALLVFLSRRSGASLAALAVVMAITLALVGVERFIITDREQIEAETLGLADAIEANDVAGVLDHIDPAATQIRADVEALMPHVRWSVANAASITVTLNEGADPPTASSRFRAFLQGIHSRSGVQVPYINQQVDMTWVNREGRWLMDGYTAYYDGKPIDAVSSASANRPLP